MNSDEAFVRAALYQSCVRSEILQHVDIANSDTNTLRDLLNKDHMLNLRKLPIVMTKIATKAGAEFIIQKFPKLKNYISTSNFNTNVEDDEMAWLLENSSNTKPRIAIIVAKNIFVGIMGHSINEFKNKLIGNNTDNTILTSNKNDANTATATVTTANGNGSLSKIGVQSVSPSLSINVINQPKEYTDIFNTSSTSSSSSSQVSVKSMRSRQPSVSSTRSNVIRDVKNTRLQSRAISFNSNRIDNSNGDIENTNSENINTNSSNNNNDNNDLQIKDVNTITILENKTLPSIIGPISTELTGKNNENDYKMANDEKTLLMAIQPANDIGSSIINDKHQNILTEMQLPNGIHKPNTEQSVLMAIQPSTMTFAATTATANTAIEDGSIIEQFVLIEKSHQNELSMKSINNTNNDDDDNIVTIDDDDDNNNNVDVKAPKLNINIDDDYDDSNDDDDDDDNGSYNGNESENEFEMYNNTYNTNKKNNIKTEDLKTTLLKVNAPNFNDLIESTEVKYKIEGSITRSNSVDTLNDNFALDDEDDDDML